MNAEADVLKDLTSGLGWELLVQHAAAELKAAREQLIHRRVDGAGLTEAGLDLARYQAHNLAVAHLLAWPARRAAELERTT